MSLFIVRASQGWGAAFAVVLSKAGHTVWTVLRTLPNSPRSRAICCNQETFPSIIPY